MKSRTKALVTALIVAAAVVFRHAYRNSPPVIFDARKTPTTDQN